MSYKLIKPYTDTQRADFIVAHQGLQSKETGEALWFMEANEMWDDETQKPIINPNYEQEQAQKEAERVARLHLTRGDVFRGLLQAKGVTREQLRALILAMPDGLDKEMALIDFDEALEFYRGVALIDTVGLALGITSNQMTKFFETNDYMELTREEII